MKKKKKKTRADVRTVNERGLFCLCELRLGFILDV